MTTNADPELTKAQASRAAKTGACVALVCSRECGKYEYVRHRDGYPICWCGHSQDVHARGPEAAQDATRA